MRRQQGIRQLGHHAAFHWQQVAKCFYLIDTFSGPVTSQFSDSEIGRGRLEVAEAALARGAYETDIARVAANFAEWPNAIVLQGAVPEVLPRVRLPRSRESNGDHR
jgi:hypothetical protein